MKLLLALALAVSAGDAARLPPAPIKRWTLAWQKSLVTPSPLEFKPREVGGPTIDDASGMVVVGTRDGFLHAIDQDGIRAWDFKTGGRIEAAPAVFDDLVLTGSSDGRLYAVEMGSGRLRWSYDALEEVGTTPVVADGVVVVMTLQDSLVGVDAKTGTWKWRHRREGKEGFTIRGAANAAVVSGLAVGAYSDGTVAAVDLQTGTVRWERRVAPQGDFMDVDGLRADGSRLYVAAYSGVVQALDAQTGKELWSVKAPAACRVAVGGGMVVAVTATQVVGLSAPDGKARWTVPLAGEPAGAPVLVSASGIRAAVPNGRGLLYIDVMAGRLLRTFDPGTGVSAAPAVRGKRAYVLSNGGELIALDFV
ncbi:MAG TPA: PQQ-binding-like beta-propeller repeat protein [Anaeromyxobacteraceae bacterium]|nr:PQQ-binding-like beta-propeller repeat protein [Anaeromyxobacteraceae bacterium]